MTVYSTSRTIIHDSTSCICISTDKSYLEYNTIITTLNLPFMLLQKDPKYAWEDYRINKFGDLFIMQ